MKKQVEPIILTVALLLLAIGAALLAYLYPIQSAITGIKPQPAQGTTVPPLKADDVAASLSSWGTPVLWNEPANHERMFQSEKYLFFASAYPKGDSYVRKLTPDLRLPSGMLWSWCEERGLDPTDANIDREDPDNDGFSNLTEFKNEPVSVRYNAKDLDGSKSTDPHDAKSHPDYLGRLRLQKFEQQPFHIFFNGYQQLNGVYLFQLHLDEVPPYNQPQLKKSGDELGFGGYVIGPFHQQFQDIMDPNTHNMVHTDVSTLELDQQETGEKVIVPFRQKINSPEVTADFVMLMPADRDKVIRISVGKILSISYLPGTTFLVVSADDKGATIKETKSGKTYSILTLDEKEWDEVPLPPASNQP